MGWAGKTPKQIGLRKAQNEASLGWARFDVLTETTAEYTRMQNLLTPGDML
jgi:hypothetical protein